MKGKFITLLLSMIFVGFSAYCQIKLPLVVEEPIKFKKLDTFSIRNQYISPSMLVSPSFYSSNLAFFCRQELKFEKVTKIPFKFRLGSVNQVDYLEGKKNVVLHP